MNKKIQNDSHEFQLLGSRRHHTHGHNMQDCSLIRVKIDLHMVIQGTFLLVSLNAMVSCQLNWNEISYMLLYLISNQ